MPKCSLIIATYNRPQLLQRAIESARRAGADVEIVVADDASSDETAAVCRGLEGIHYVRAERRQMVAGIRNIGIVASTGDYIGFLDDDDLRLPGSLDLQLEALEAAPEAGMVYGQAFHGDAHGRRLATFYPASCPQGDLFWELLEGNFIPCPSAVFRRSCLSRIGLLDDAAPGVEDWDLWLRIAELYPLAAVGEPVAIWRRASPVSGQYSSRAASMLTLCARLFEERWLRLPRAAAASAARRNEARRKFMNRLIDQLVWETSRAIRYGRLGQARETLAAALRLSPRLSLRKGLSAKTLNFLLNGVLDRWRLAQESEQAPLEPERLNRNPE